MSALATPRARAAEEGEQEKADTEFAALPIVGGDSDVGIGGGVIASVARVEPNLEPYLWRLEAVAMGTVKPEDGKYQLRYMDAYLLLTAPHVIRDRLGLSFRLSFTKESDLSYYGIGNASEFDEGRDENDPYYAYDWVHPKAEAGLEYQIGHGFELVTGISYTHNTVSVPPDGKLAADSQSTNGDLQYLTELVPEYGVAAVSFGLNWDTRDDEVATERGHFHSLRVDLAPSIGEEVPYAWLRTNLALRQYVRLIPNRLSLAARLVVDALLGQPPFYELARIDSTFAIGGGRGVRGIPAPRYYGMLKALTNLEVRARLFSFNLWEKDYDFGVVAFTDLGRVVADYDGLAELDGSGLGIKAAFGGGLRIRAGKSFVLRVDVAGSPAEGSLSAYLAAGHLF